MLTLKLETKCEQIKVTSICCHITFAKAYNFLSSFLFLRIPALKILTI